MVARESKHEREPLAGKFEIRFRHGAGEFRFRHEGEINGGSCAPSDLNSKAWDGGQGRMLDGLDGNNRVPAWREYGRLNPNSWRAEQES